jgi:tRNA 5-methylaminomethyl-2-thiouridine biosynthesis bifunctional protein
MKNSHANKAFSDPQSLAATPVVAAALMANLHTTPLQVDQRYQELVAIYLSKGFFGSKTLNQQEMHPGQSQCSIEVLDHNFGVGLDFLLTWKLWLEAFESSSLNYVAVCEQPLSIEDVQQLHSSWPQLQHLTVQLQDQYPGVLKGFHRLDFGKVKLTIVQAESTQALAQIAGEFDVSLGALEALAIDTAHGKEKAKAYVPPWRRPRRSVGYASKVAIVGAGICGTATALSLSERGFDVTLIEQGPKLASGASGNRQGMLYAKLPDNATIAGQFHQQGLQHSLAALKRHVNSNHWQACGLLQLATSDKHTTQMQAVIQRHYPPSWLQWLSQSQAEDLAKQPLSAGGLYFPHSGWVSPIDWCETLYTKSGADLWLNTKVISMQQTQKRGWQLSLSGSYAGEYEFDAVVIANANGANTLLAQQDLPLKSIRGQVSYVKTQESPALVVCGEGYVTPTQKGVLAVGASYNLDSNDTQLSEADHAGNLGRLGEVLPSHQTSSQAANHIAIEQILVGGRVGFRAVTPDYLPMVGQVADKSEVINRFAKLRQDANYKFAQDMPYLPGLYINAGHGSKGFISAPLSAEILACQMANQSLPVAQCVAWALDPNRFIIRDLIRRKR